MTDTITRGDCQTCYRSTPLANGKTVERHLTEHEQPGAEAYGDNRWVCIGSGHPPAQGDEFDVTRAYAVARHALARRSAVKLRSKMAQTLALKPAWEIGSVIQHYAPIAMMQEALTGFWRDLAAAPDPLHVVKDALAALYLRGGGSHTEYAVEAAKSAAARQFMVEVRYELQRAYPNGWTADQVFSALFSI